MKKILVITGLTFGMFIGANIAEAETLKGVWSSGNASSLEILSGQKVKYCFLKQCTTQKYKGDANGTISFSWGSDHHYKFTKTKSGYRGVYNNQKDMTIDVK